jgi:outer membrane biosynthesis protein TonB
VVAPSGRRRRTLVLAGVGMAVALIAAGAFAAPALAPSAEPGSPPAASPAVPPGLLALPADDRPTTSPSPAVPVESSTTTPTEDAPQPAPPAPEPTTSQGPPPGPTTGGPTTFRTEGGSATATCAGNQATLIDWAAADGYRVERVNPGPAQVATVQFRRGSQTSRLSIGCVDGAPARSI